MKLQLFAGIIAIAYAQFVLADNASKVKLTAAKILDSNDKYYNRSAWVLELVPGNATHNYLRIAFQGVKDLPSDTNFVAEISRSDAAQCSNYKKIKSFSVSLCSDLNNPNNQYLADTLQALKKSGQCGKARSFEVARSDYVKFYNLLTDAQLKNGCFRVINTLISGTNVMYSEQLDFVSNQ